jgi:release factor glutamine methyltransferase
VTLDEIVTEARRTLATATPPISARESRWIVGLALGLSETALLARSDRPLGAADIDGVRRLVARRLAGEPFAYLAGEREFYGRSFLVDARVLVPRPETEHLVEETLRLPGATRRVLDVGTGSGAIALTLALESPRDVVVGSDLSPAALAVAERNRRRLAAPARLVGADGTRGLDLASFDVVVSNPPYVAVDDPEVEPGVRAHEPHLALFAEDEGYAMLERLIGAAGAAAVRWLLLEIGAGQADRIARRARAAGFPSVRFAADLAGHPRVAILGRP